MIRNAFRSFLFFLTALFFTTGISHAQTPGLGGVLTSNEQVLWLDASSLSLSNGAVVESWPDLSGNGNHAGQTNSLMRPLFISNGGTLFNNHPVIRFDGTDDYLRVEDNPNLDNTNGLTVFVVGKTSSSSGARAFISKRLGDMNQSSYAFFLWNNASLHFDAPNSSSRLSSGTAHSLSSSYVFSGVYNGEASRKYLYSNAAPLTNNAAEATLPRYEVPLTIGILNEAYESSFQGDMAEIIIFRAALNEAQRQIIENILAKKYSINIGANYLLGSFTAPYTNDFIGVGTTNGLNKQIVNTGKGGGIYISEINNSFDETNEFIYAAHNNVASDEYSTTDLPIGVINRASRSWRIEKSQNGIAGAGTTDVSLSFNLNEMGLEPDDSKTHVLLYRSAPSGPFTLVTGVSSNIVNGIVTFNLNNAQFQNGYYTFGKIYQSVKTWYSYKDGSWESPLSWSLNATAYLNPSGLTPSTSLSSEYDNVVVQNGHTITVSGDGHSNFSLAVEAGAVLNFQLSQGHSFGMVSGKGKIILYSEVWPTGDFSLFTAPSGGTISYQGSTGFDLTIPRTVNNMEIATAANQSIVLDTDYFLNGNLTIKSGILQFNNDVGAAVTLWVSNDLNVSTGASIVTSTLNVRNRLFVRGNLSNNGTMRFTNRTAPIYGSDATDGITDVYFDYPSRNQTIALFGVSDFYKIIVNKGSDDTYEAFFYAGEPTYFRLLGRSNQEGGGTPPNRSILAAFSLQAGTARLGTNISLPFLITSNNYDIDSDARLWLDGGSISNPSTSNAIVVYGTLQVSSGNLEVRSHEGITIRETGTVRIQGGSTLANIIRTSVISGIHRGAYEQTGGTVVVDRLSGSSDGNGAHYRFSLPYPDNAYTMSGGTLTIRSPKTISGAGQYGGILIGALPANISVSGGKVRLEHNIDKPFYINSTAPFYNLELIKTHSNSQSFLITSYPGNTANPTVPPLEAQPLVVLNNLSILNPLPSTVYTNFDANGNDVVVYKDFIIDSRGAYITGANTTSFVGPSNSRFEYKNKTTSLYLNNLSIEKDNNTGLLTFESLGRTSDYTQEANTIAVVNGLLSVTKGMINYQDFRIDAKEDIVNGGVIGLESQGRLRLNGAAKQNIRIPSDFNNAGFGRIVVNNALDVQLSGNNVELIRDLILESGVFDLQSFGITVDALSTSGTFNDKTMVQTSGLNSDGGLRLYIENDGNYVFPIGTNANGVLRFTPLNAVFSKISEPFYLQLNPVAEELSLLANNTPGMALKYYWRVRHSEISELPLIDSYLFHYNEADLPVPLPSPFVPGKVVGPSRSHEDASNIYLGEKTIMFNNDGNGSFELEEGYYTAGHPDKFVGNVRVFYSRGIILNDFPGDSWSNPNTWSEDGFGGDPSGNLPGSGDIVKIGNHFTGGSFRNHRVFVNGNVDVAELIFERGEASANPRLTVYDTTVTANYHRISGTGTLMYYMGSTSATVLADFGEFSNQEESEFIYSRQSGNPHNVPSNILVYPKLRFEGSGVFNMPEADILVKSNLWIMSGGANVFINSGSAGDITIYGNLQLGQEGNTNYGRLTFPGTGNPRTVDVKGDIIMVGNASPLISVVSPGNTSLEHTLIAQNNIKHSAGNIYLYHATSARVALKIGGTNSASYSRVNGNINLHRIIMDKGTNADSTFTFNNSVTLSHPSNLPVKPITFLNGCLVLNHSDIDINLSSGGGNAEIVATSALEIQQGKARLSGSGVGLILSGRLGLSNTGQFLANGASNNYIQYTNSNKSVLSISDNALLEVAESIKGATTFTNANIRYYQTGGNVKVGTLGSSLNSPTFEIRNNNSRFRFLGGSIYILRKGENNVAFLADSCNADVDPVWASMCFGDGASTPVSTIFAVNSAIPFPNLVLQGNNAFTVKQESKPMVVLGDFTIGSGKTFQTNALDFSLHGDLTNNGTFTASPNKSVFLQGITQVLTGTLNFQNLTIQSDAQVELNSLLATAIGVNGNLNILSGSLIDNGREISIKGNIINNGTHASPVAEAGGLLLNGSGLQTIQGTGSLGRLKINNTSGLALASDHQVNNSIIFQNGSINLGSRLLTLDANSALVAEGSPFSASKMIYTDGTMNALGVKKGFPANVFDFSFPVGTVGKFASVRFHVVQNNEAGYISVVPVNSELSAAVGAGSLNPKVLNYYWNIGSEGFNNLLSNVYLYYNQVDVRSGHVEAEYMPARLMPDGNWQKILDVSLVDETANVISFLNVPSLTAEYTAGYGLPDKVALFTSRQDGSWNDVNTWESNDLPQPLSEIPYGSIVIIREEDEVTISSDNRNAYRTEIYGRLNLGATSQHVLGKVSGTGTLAIESGSLPAGRYDEFFACGGGTIEFGGTSTNYTIPSRVEKVNRIRFTGSGQRILPSYTLQVCELLEISGQAILNNLENNILIKLSGDLVMESGASFMDGVGNASIEMLGTSLQSISGPFVGNSGINKLIINNAAGVELLSDIEINSSLVFTKGLLNTTSTAMLQLNYGASYSGEDNNRYVNGPMRKKGFSSSGFVFPIGKNGIYAPAGLSNLQNQSNLTVFSAEYFDFGHPNAADVNEPLERVSSLEYWDISRLATSASGRVKLHWEDAQNSMITDPTALRVAHFNGSSWEDNGYLGSYENGNIGWVMSEDVSSFSPFTFGATTDYNSNPLPVELLAFTASDKDDYVRLDWTTASEINNDFFTIERSSDMFSFDPLAIVSGSGNSNVLLSYQYDDREPLEGVSYYRLKQTDFDGSFKYSEVIKMQRSTILSEGLNMLVYPNPVANGFINVSLSGLMVNEDVQVIIFDITGRQQYSGFLSADENGVIVNRIDLNNDMKKGVYILNISSRKGGFSQKLVIN